MINSHLWNLSRHKHAPVAQRIEHLPSKQGVAGSSPAGRTLFSTVCAPTPSIALAILSLLHTQLHTGYDIPLSDPRRNNQGGLSVLLEYFGRM
jgi:hypothetical protein